MELAEFLLARITEDEARARAESERYERVSALRWEVVRTPEATSRALAECEAKRRIVELASEQGAETSGDYVAWCAMRYLALPYAGHPDYDEAWRP